MTPGDKERTERADRPAGGAFQIGRVWARSTSAAMIDLLRFARPGVIGLFGVTVAVACSSGSSGSSGPPSSSDVHTGIGPVPLAAGQEETVCIVKPLGNAEALVLKGFDMSLAPGSHHLIAYSTGAAEVDEPYPCSPFTGVVVGDDVPLAFANTDQVSFAFPDGVGIDLPANAMVKIEAHYINSSAHALLGQGSVTLHGTPKASAGAYQAANFMAMGTFNINIPPNATATTGPQFQASDPGLHMVLVTTHQHRLGTGIKVWASSEAGDLSHPIADDPDWATPAWRPLTPQIDFDGKNGLTYQCDWTNTTDQTINFGESALNEMCIVAGYYYPSRGVYGCFDGKCSFRGTP